MAKISTTVNDEDINISKSDVKQAFDHTEESLEDRKFEMNYSPWHFVEFDGVKKPVKHVYLNIDSVSTVADSRQAFTTLEAEEDLEELGVPLYNRKKHAEEILRDTFVEILQGYPERTGTASKDKRLYQLLVNKAPNFVKHIANKNFDETTFNFKGTAGQGNWPNIPWVAALHPDVTDTTQKGVYAVYLFDPEDQAVYATLNQGVTELENNQGKKEARRILKERAQRIREEIVLEEFSTEEPEFSDKNNLYGPSTIYQKKYELENVPDSQEIREDLMDLLNSYSEFVGSDLQERYPKIGIGEDENIGKDISLLARQHGSNYNYDKEEVDQELARFRNKFPESEIGDLDFDEWAPKGDNPKKEDAVYYWLQYEMGDVLGGFAPGYAENYLVRYKDGERKVEGYDRPPEEVFEEMKQNFVEALELLDSGKYSEIDELNPLPKGSILLRWFVFYRPDKIIPIYTKSGMKELMNALELDTPDSYFEMNERLLEYKQSYDVFSDWSNYKFARFVWDYKEGELKKDSSQSRVSFSDGQAKLKQAIEADEKLSADLEIKFDDLYFPEDEEESIKNQIEASLNSGKHIIFTGPPGTGKTELAEKVAEEMEDKDENVTGHQLTTATSDWSTFDTVGGYRPEDDGSLEFKPGHILRRFKDDEKDLKNEPLVIDEINRANIDKAFGQLFTVLSGQRVQLPFTKGEAEKEVEVVPGKDFEKPVEDHEFVVPESWRILATMNTYDKTSLYEMSYAFMRRFSFIRIEAPDLEGANRELMKGYLDAWELEDLYSEEDNEIVLDENVEDVAEIWKRVNNAVEGREIGPAIAKDMIEFLNVNDRPTKDANTAAITNFIFPQLEGVPDRKKIVDSLLGEGLDVDENRLKSVAGSMLQVEFNGQN